MLTAYRPEPIIGVLGMMAHLMLRRMTVNLNQLRKLGKTASVLLGHQDGERHGSST